MANQAPTSTHKAVQEYYSQVARESGNCCGPSANQKQIHNDLYPVDLLSGLPSDIANFSAGSGDPISLAKLKPGETVLDLGSGAGLDCFLAARLVGESGHVIGVDMTPDMLERARANAARVSFKNIEFRQGYLEKLPVDDHSIDVIISNCVINLSPDKPGVFREMFRALKPGGRIAVSDMVSNRTMPEKASEGEEWCNCTSGALSDKDFARGLSEAGFDDIRIEPNLEIVQKAIDSGRVGSQAGRTKEQMLEDLRNWDQCERTMVVPHRITASKPIERK
jgi:SAM-dependent methyltransferase